MVDANYISNRQLNLMTQESEIIGYFVRGQKQAISSQNLRLEYTDTSIRLSNNNAILIGISKQVNQWQRKVLVSNNSPYKPSIVKALESVGFFARRKSSHPDFSEYHDYQIPDGYKLNYTEVIQLWRTWWHHKRYQPNTSNLPIDILVFHKGKWQAIRDLQPKQGNFVVLTAKGEIAIEPAEYLVWIDRSSATVVTPSPQLDRNRLMQKDYLNRLPEPEEYIDLEAYLSTFNTEDSEDIDRIEGIYNIDELLRDSSITSRTSPAPKPAVDVQVEPAVVNNLPQPAPSSVVIPNSSTQIPSSDLERRASLKLKAMSVLETYLHEGELIVHTEVLKNAQGQEISRKIIEIKRDCPSWAIEQVKLIEN
jgi:hypothetical protein